MMSEVNKEELRRLAEDCVAFEHSWPSEKAEKTELFRDKANPATVLALLDELDNCARSWGLMRAENEQLRARELSLETALQAAGDLAASTRGGPAQEESLRIIEEITAKAYEHREGRLSALERAAVAESERDQYRDMAACIDLLRRDQIAAGVIGESCPPMFMTEAVLGYIGTLEGERAKLRAELSACKDSPGGCGYWREAAKLREAERDALLAEVEALRKDAERYRWFRMADWWRSPICAIRNPKVQAKLGSDCPSGDRLDEQIDAAMSKGERQDG